MVKCCGKEMYEAGIFLHCFKCNKRLIKYPQGQTRGIVLQLLREELDGLGWTQTAFLKMMREVYREATYEDYEGDIDPSWEMAVDHS